ILDSDVETRSRAVVKAGRNRLKPDVVRLEDRRLLSTFTVTNPLDTFNSDGTPVDGTLRWAVAQANLTGGSTVNFDLTDPTTIALSKMDDVILILQPMTITGPGAAALTISGSQESGIFQIENVVTATISGLTVSDGFAGYAAVDDLGTLKL